MVGARSWLLGGLHFWCPKLPASLSGISRARRRRHLFLGFNLTFFPQFILGYLGMPRAIPAIPLISSA